MMELKNVLKPWNWFKKEEEQNTFSPVQVMAHTTRAPLDRFHQEIDQLFNSFVRGVPDFPFFREVPGSWNSMMRPQVDIAERGKEYLITVEVPGVEEKDLELTISEETLTVRGEKRSEKEEDDQQYHRVERSYGAFQRMISLPEDADDQEVKAKFKNGVLRISVKKNTAKTSSARKIAVNE